MTTENIKNVMEKFMKDSNLKFENFDISESYEMDWNEVSESISEDIVNQSEFLNKEEPIMYHGCFADINDINNQIYLIEQNEKLLFALTVENTLETKPFEHYLVEKFN